MKNGLLSYDFYLPIYNLLIEFQGIQHEQPIEYFGGEEQFEIQQEHDKRKREYAKQNNINLLEIWYYDIDNIEEILTNTLNNLKLESLETATSAQATMWVKLLPYSSIEGTRVNIQSELAL